MKEEDLTRKEEEPGQMLRMFFGGLLIIAGSLVCASMLNAGYGLLNEGRTFPLIEQLTSRDNVNNVMEAQGMSIKLPPALFQLGAYALALLVMVVIARIGMGFIKHGATMLAPDVRRSVDKLAREMEQRKKSGGGREEHNQ